MPPLKIRRIGNSLGATFPRDVIERLRVAEGDTVYLAETPNGFELTPFDPEFGRAIEGFQRVRKRYRNALRELAK